MVTTSADWSATPSSASAEASTNSQRAARPSWVAAVRQVEQVRRDVGEDDAAVLAQPLQRPNAIIPSPVPTSRRVSPGGAAPCRGRRRGSGKESR